MIKVPALSALDRVDISQVTSADENRFAICQPAVKVAALEADSEVTPQIQILKGLVRTESKLPRSRLIRMPIDPSAMSLPHPIFHQDAVRATGVGKRHSVGD